LARDRGLVADQPHPGKERASMATATAARPTSYVRTALRPKRPRAKWFLPFLPLVHAPDAGPAIEKALKRAREK